MDNKVIEFIKGLMQPGITVFAVLAGAYLVFTGKIAPGDAWWLVLGVIGFWFGKTVGLFGDAKNTTTSLKETNADLIQTVTTQSQDLATSTPAPVVNTILEKLTPAVTTTVTTGPTVTGTVDTDPDPDEYLKEIS